MSVCGWSAPLLKQNERNRSDCFRLKPIIIPPKPGFYTLALQVRRGSGGAEGGAEAPGREFTDGVPVTGPSGPSAANMTHTNESKEGQALVSVQRERGGKDKGVGGDTQSENPLLSSH